MILSSFLGLLFLLRHAPSPHLLPFFHTFCDDSFSLFLEAWRKYEKAVREGFALDAGLGKRGERKPLYEVLTKQMEAYALVVLYYHGKCE